MADQHQTQAQNQHPEPTSPPDSHSHPDTAASGAPPPPTIPPFPTKTLKPPYYAAIFTSIRHPSSSASSAEYGATAARMITLSQQQPGFLGMESVADGGPDAGGTRSITISYWADEASIAAWRRDLEHTAARRRGRDEWYERFEVRVARVERGFGFERRGGAEE